MKSKRTKKTNASVLTIADVRRVVREELERSATIVARVENEWLPIAAAPRGEWLLVSSGGPVRNPGGFGWHIAQVTDESLRNSPPYAECWGGGSYMGVKWYMPLPPLRMEGGLCSMYT